jgi:hypothetical protein
VGFKQDFFWDQRCCIEGSGLRASATDVISETRGHAPSPVAAARARSDQGHSPEVDSELAAAYRDDDHGDDSGSAYVYHRDGSTWDQERKLTANDGATDDWFGASVAISGNRVVVGAYGDDDHGCDSGSAYVFRRCAAFPALFWLQETKLAASGAGIDDRFGWSVAISDNRIVVGAPARDSVGFYSDSGAVNVFQYDGSTWSEEQTWCASDTESGDFLGASVAISGQRVVIGAPYRDEAGDDAGAAYSFNHPNAGTW